MWSKRGEFDIRNWFIMISLITIIVVNIVMALVLDRYITERVVLREGKVAQDFLNSTVELNGIGDHLFDSPKPSPALVSFSNHVRNLPGMVRANIYAPDGFINFSTEQNLVGFKFEDNEELSESLAGKLISKLELVSDDDKAEHLALNPFSHEELMESYIPIFDKSKRVLAVVEFYTKPTEIKQIIAEIMRVVWAAAALSGIILFLALYSAVARGARIIENQKREITSMTALAVLGQMAGAVAHSMRNPLANIRSSAELLQHQHPDVGGQAAHDIYGEVDRMNRHMHELLEYARSDKAPVQTVDLFQTLRSSLDRINEGLKRRNIEFVIEADKGIEHLVEIEVMMFSQAINSIISNAVEAMPEGGTIKVVVGNAHNGRSFTVDISDTGKGIPRELLDRLPEPFLTSKTQGLGLGLSLARRILERFGGSLSLRSEEGRGTTVTLEIPKAN
jgi:two-component system, NtrC family, sensor histidine kinase HydH